MPANSNSLKRRKLALFKKHPYCFWCECEVILEKITLKPEPSNLASLDHLISKKMGRSTKDVERTVLSCKQCNMDRNSIENKIVVGKKLTPRLIELKNNIFDPKYKKIMDSIPELQMDLKIC